MGVFCCVKVTTSDNQSTNFFYEKKYLLNTNIIIEKKINAILKRKNYQIPLKVAFQNNSLKLISGEANEKIEIIEATARKKSKRTC